MAARVSSPARVSPTTRHRIALCAWAETVPRSQWKKGPPRITSSNREIYWVCQTRTGQILSGPGDAFQPRWLTKIAANPKYGEVILHLEAGD
jgi:hypothetical protein